ncbi:glycerol acyltransferase [Rhodocytophaga rosea]|uniref:Glycerol acyltransferase n=1 Tax=Rhodocytophaga rosea TaxID=2704465 RepID=A0A6C0GI38_9BACT|nr:lysophospholipid acyltransferase family protein [Rhodocytophaga rosea]QHT67731.1 glycerol acyltransferase [Rhodocytophaga rosea]
MIKPARYLLTDWFWRQYYKFIIQADFSQFSFNQDIDISREKALLVLANHFSWWDGFLLYHLNELFFHKRFHVMMLQEQLKQYSFLRYSGAYSVQRKGKSLLESLQYTSRLLENPGNIVLIFPQGKIESMHTPYIHFEKGIKHIADHCEKDIQILFSVALVDYASQRKPALQLYLKEYTHQKTCSLAEMEMAFNEHYQQSLRCQRNRLSK